MKTLLASAAGAAGAVGAEVAARPQISESWELAGLMLLGSALGAITAFFFDNEKASAARRAHKTFGAFLAGFGMAFFVVTFFKINLSNDHIAAVSWVSGAMGWMAFPLIQKGMLKRVLGFINPEQKP